MSSRRESLAVAKTPESYVTRKSDELTESSAGFAATLHGASLFDLVQMECLAGRSGAVRVTSGGDVGYLFFRGGRVVHALTLDTSGEAAALQILSWDRGSFEPCPLAEPEQMTIQTSFQNLLLRAAQARDDQRRGLSSVGPAEDAPPPTSRSPAAVHDTKPPPLPRRSISGSLPAQSSSPGAAASKIECAVRLNRAGAVLSSAGDSGLLAETTAYALRLAELLGTSLGLGTLRGLECELEDGSRTIVYAESAEVVVGIRAAHDADLSAVRKKGGL